MTEKSPGSISIKNVSKVFKKAAGSSSTYSTLKSFFLQSITGKKKIDLENTATGFKRYKALDDISIDLKPGSSTALIGRNGSGKSTILKLIAGIYTPDSGSVQVNGKVSALIELGAGFHPDFTGRENIFLGGIMFGLSRKEIKDRFDKIVEYAELAHVIDEPVRTYSSGMYMRLGFSLAIHTEPDILLVDEVLAVGDAHFINRCQDSISEFKRKGKTLVFVTHDLSSVSKWCDQAIWLHQGKIKQTGHPREISDAYLGSIHQQEEKELENLEMKLQEEVAFSVNEAGSPHDLNSKRWGNSAVTITSVKMKNVTDGTFRDSVSQSQLQGTPLSASQPQSSQWIFSENDSLVVEIRFSSKALPLDTLFGVGIIRIDGTEVFGTNTGMQEDIQKQLKDIISQGKGSDDACIRFSIARLGLTEGSYFLDVACHAEDGTPYDYHHRMHKFQVRNKNNFSVGIISPECQWDLSTLQVHTTDKDSKKVSA